MNEWLQRTRLISGCVLLLYVTLHLLNTALGNISLEAMEIGRVVFLSIWRNPVGTTVIMLALFLHMLLVLIALFRRRRLRMPIFEAVQVFLGFLIPILLATHVIANRGAHELYGLNDTYVYVLLSLWVWDPSQAALQIVAVIVTWTHGCLGIYFWLRLKPFFPAFRNYGFIIALLVPALAITGFASAGKEVALLHQNDVWLQTQLAEIGLPGRDAVNVIYGIADRIRIGTVVAVMLILLLRVVRNNISERSNQITIHYPNGKQAKIARGLSLLDASRSADIPHASVCGGRGRCSTCRVRLLEPIGEQPLPSDAEAKVLKRVGATEGVRLACQLRPQSDLSIVPLLPPGAQPKDGFGRPDYLQGAERRIAILFADLRAFTKFSERKLPFDVVFVINQYFRAMGGAVESAGGQLDKFVGDGVMALFGIESGSEAGCRQALIAARNMSRAMVELNEQLRNNMDEPLRIGIGIHTGPAIVGEMGYRHVTNVTAIGDAVNTASRLEGMTKTFTCQLVFSEDVGKLANIDLNDLTKEEIAVRGRQQKMTVYVVQDASALPLAD